MFQERGAERGAWGVHKAGPVSPVPSPHLSPWARSLDTRWWNRGSRSFKVGSHKEGSVGTSDQTSIMSVLPLAGVTVIEVRGEDVARLPIQSIFNFNSHLCGVVCRVGARSLRGSSPARLGCKGNTRRPGRWNSSPPRFPCQREAFHRGQSEGPQRAKPAQEDDPAERRVD